MPSKPTKNAAPAPKPTAKAKATTVAQAPATAADRASAIRLCCFDVDGSLTDGRLFLDAEGRESKAFHVHDGQGLRLLEDKGIVVALVTARDSRAAVARGRELGLRHVFVGVKDKLACVKHLAGKLGLGLHEVAFFGDDLPDLRAFAAVGLAAGPANTHPWVRGHAHWLSTLEGGRGAAREFCDFLLETQGHRQAILDGLLP